MTMSLEPLVFRRVSRVFVVPDVPRKIEVIDTTGMEVLEPAQDGTNPPAHQREDSEDAPVPFASTLRHV